MEGPVNSEREDLGQVSSVLPLGLPLGLVSSVYHWLFELCESQTLRQGARDQARWSLASKSGLQQARGQLGLGDKSSRAPESSVYSVVCAGKYCHLSRVCRISLPSALWLQGMVGWKAGVHLKCWVCTQRGFHHVIVQFHGLWFLGDGVTVEELRERPTWGHAFGNTIGQLFKNGAIFHFLMFLCILGGI